MLGCFSCLVPALVHIYILPHIHPVYEKREKEIETEIREKNEEVEVGNEMKRYIQ